MALDADDLKKIGELIAASKPKPEEIAALVAPTINAALKPVNERLDGADKAAKAAEAKATADAEEARKKAEADAAKDKKTGEPDPQQTRIAALEAKVKASEDARAAAEAQSKRDALERAVRDQLGAKGIPAGSAKYALAALREEGVIIEHDGKPHWKGKVNDVDGTHALDAGIDAWVKGDGKIFLPPSPVRGSGSETGTRPPTQGGQTINSLDDLLKNI